MLFIYKQIFRYAGIFVTEVLDVSYDLKQNESI